MHKAISLMDAFPLAIVSAIGPLFVFALQIVEERVDYAWPTLIGLIIYFLGAIVAAYGSLMSRNPGNG